MLESLTALQAEHSMDSISITTHGATVALLGGDSLALPVLDYKFSGPMETNAAYGTVRPDFAETLSPLLPNGLNIGAQLFWQSQCFADQFASVT